MFTTEHVIRNRKKRCKTKNRGVARGRAGGASAPPRAKDDKKFFTPFP